MTQSPVAEDHSLAPIEQSQSVAFAIPLEEFRANIKAIEQVVHEYLVEGEDWGTIPGTPKPTLYKPGAEKLCDLYGFSMTFEVTHRIEDWERPSLTGVGTFPFIHYEVRCDLLRRSDGRLVSSGVGACSSMETKYRWRNAKLTCPTCGKDLRKSKQDAGYYCWTKTDGCGAQFPASIAEGQALGKTENPEIADQVNTILKMASKRALIDATLHATRSSGLLTQDIEDMVPTNSGVVEGSYRDLDEDAPAANQPPAPPKHPVQRVDGPKPMTARQKEYLFGGGKAPLDSALAVRYLGLAGGSKGMQAKLDDNSLPAAVAACVRFQSDGRLSWAGDITEELARDLIECLKGELGVGETGEGTARAAFWALCNELGVPKDAAHMFFRVPQEDGELAKYVAARAKRLKTTQAAVWKIMRSQVEKAVEFDSLMKGAPDEAEPAALAVSDPADVPFE